MEIKIKYLVDIEPIKILEQGDWIDLRCAENVDLKQGEFKLIPLGIAMELPKGYEALVVPRSSTFKKYHIMQTNSIGVIDCAYNGDNDQWFMPVIAMADTHIDKNDRICQFRLFKNQDAVDMKEVEFLGNQDRGGFGSSGVK